MHYLTANGVEIRRQRVPYNAAAIASALINAGADVNATAHVYGAQHSVLALLTSSSHPQAAGVMDELARVLTQPGANGFNM